MSVLQNLKCILRKKKNHYFSFNFKRERAPEFEKRKVSEYMSQREQVCHYEMVLSPGETERWSY